MLLCLNAELLVNEPLILSPNTFVEMVVWRLSLALSGSTHTFKYRLAFIVDGRCVMRYENEAGRGDHSHLEDDESPCLFTTAQALLEDFWRDVDNWRS